MKILPILLAVLTPSLVLAVAPRDLTTEQPSDDPRYGVKSAPTTSETGAQPVDIMNWLLDENGNLKVSNQVRDRAILLIPQRTDLAASEEWVSDWIDASRFNVLFFRWAGGAEGTYAWTIEWMWFPDRLDTVFAEVLESYPVRIKGPRFRLRLSNLNAPAYVIWAGVYLRAE